MEPPPEGLHYPTLSSLIDAVNHHAGAAGYAVVKARSKVSKKGVLRICYLQCDRGGKPRNNPRSDKRIHASSRCIECSFSSVAKLDDEGSFNAIIYSTTRQEYEDAWNSIQDAYNLSHPEAVQYIQEEWLYWKKKFVKFWTNQVLHFKNNTTSRSEGGHRTLKRSLQFSTGNHIFYSIYH